jgi:hypothetical protein
MTGELLSNVVRTFVLKYVDSVGELEGLLPVRASQAQSWSASRLAGRLYISEVEASDVLHALHRRNLLSREGTTYRYAPAAVLRPHVDMLAEAYPQCLIPITHLIHGKK